MNFKLPVMISPLATFLTFIEMLRNFLKFYFSPFYFFKLSTLPEISRNLISVNCNISLKFPKILICWNDTYYW